MSDELLLLEQAFGAEPIGLKTNAVRWLQQQVMRQSLTLPRRFATRVEWEDFRTQLRAELPGVIGLPAFPPLGQSLVRANLPDQWWPVSAFALIEAFTRQIYRLYGAEDRVDFRAETHEHNLTGPFADALEQFLLQWV